MTKCSEAGLIRSFDASLQSTDIINGQVIALHLYMVSTHKNSACGVTAHSTCNNGPTSGLHQTSNGM